MCIEPFPLPKKPDAATVEMVCRLVCHMNDQDPEQQIVDPMARFDMHTPIGGQRHTRPRWHWMAPAARQHLELQLAAAYVLDNLS